LECRGPGCLQETAPTPTLSTLETISFWTLPWRSEER
jgi:hypothetical protein